MEVKTIYDWDEENKIATCTLYDDRGRSFVGTAKCHPDDFPFGNRISGAHIASLRATIKYLKSIRRDVVEPELNALKQLYYSMNKSKYFSHKHYESRMLMRQIRIRENDLEIIKNQIDLLKKDIENYIKEKDTLYNKIKKRRTTGGEEN